MVLRFRTVSGTSSSFGSEISPPERIDRGRERVSERGKERDRVSLDPASQMSIMLSCQISCGDFNGLYAYLQLVT